MNSNKRRLWGEWLLTAPSFIWLTLFFLLPTLIIFAISFKPSDPLGGVGPGWTLRTLLSLRNPNYPEIIWRTAVLSITTTVVCIALAIPIAYYIARCKAWKRDLVLFLTIIPFWTSFLIRIFAWKGVLHPDGLLKQALVFCNLISPDTLLLYRPGTVLLVMIYTELPFAILPLYAAAEKFDFSLIEAAMDLGAGRLRAFCSVFIPGISSGLLSACLMVLIPSIGSYVVPDVVGGIGSEMIGNVIAQKTFVDRNLPAASAMAALMTLSMLIPLLFFLRGNKGKNQEPKPAREVV
ncbi:MAG: ABC transporter permease [Lentisphaerae bacterium]|jgi:spermidine/putrescine transport system permease protein|nr:ABC transporter permease [Lentisphaerota bacterium]